MKFIIKKEYLIEGLNNVSKAISSKNLIPILAGIKFELKNDGLYLSASDTDISIQSFISNEKISDIRDAKMILSEVSVYTEGFQIPSTIYSAIYCPDNLSLKINYILEHLAYFNNLFISYNSVFAKLQKPLKEP